uniref:SH2 domain-containing protein n=1 Tax=Heterorhabditis bacteriophora TaxID=37862 RepID=A0A1I7X6C2_HETBA
MTEEKSKNLEDQPWYHGLRPRKDILSLMAEPGEWLVRSTDSRQITEIVLSVKDKKKEPAHYTLKLVVDNIYFFMNIFKYLYQILEKGECLKYLTERHNKSVNVDNRPSMDLIAKKLKDLCKLEYRILDPTTLTIRKNKSYTKSETFVVKEAKEMRSNRYREKEVKKERDSRMTLIRSLKRRLLLVFHQGSSQLCIILTNERFVMKNNHLRK